MTLFLIIFVIILSTVMGGLLAIKFKDKLHLVLGFGAGAIFGVAMLDLLPESIDLTQNIQLTALLIVAGFSSYMLIDRSLLSHNHCSDNCNNNFQKARLGVLAIIIHSFLDGFGIGIAFKVSPAVGWVVALAVMIHSFSDGINTVSMIIKNKGKDLTAFKWLLIDVFAPVIGILVAYLIIIPNSILGIILSLFVGLFLYLSTSILIPENHHKHPVIWTTLSMIAGMFAIFFAVNL
jgi:zinc transporter ZupT